MECRLPNKLKKYRRCAGLSQKKVARALGFADTSAISRWEHGVALPNLHHVFKLSQLYDTLPHVLYAHLWNDVASSLVDYKKQTSAEEAFYL